MDTSSLKLGDRVECLMRGYRFTGTVAAPKDRYGYWTLGDVEPSWQTSRHVTSRQIVKKLDASGGPARG